MKQYFFHIEVGEYWLGNKMTVEERMFLRDPIRARKSAPNHSYAKYSEDIQNSLSESQNEIFFKDFLRLLKFNKRSKRKKYRIWLPILTVILTTVLILIAILTTAPAYFVPYWVLDKNREI